MCHQRRRDTGAGPKSVPVSRCVTPPSKGLLASMRVHPRPPSRRRCRGAPRTVLFCGTWREVFPGGFVWFMTSHSWPTSFQYQIRLEERPSGWGSALPGVSAEKWCGEHAHSRHGCWAVPEPQHPCPLGSVPWSSASGTRGPGATLGAALWHWNRGYLCFSALLETKNPGTLLFECHAPPLRPSAHDQAEAPGHTGFGVRSAPAALVPWGLSPVRDLTGWGDCLWSSGSHTAPPDVACTATLLL